jgi:hypothetical protein
LGSFFPSLLLAFAVLFGVLTKISVIFTATKICDVIVDALYELVMQVCSKEISLTPNGTFPSILGFPVNTWLSSNQVGV